MYICFHLHEQPNSKGAQTNRDKITPNLPELSLKTKEKLIDVKLSNIRSSPHHDINRKNEQWIEQNVVGWLPQFGQARIHVTTNLSGLALVRLGRCKSAAELEAWSSFGSWAGLTAGGGDRRISPGMWLLRAVKGWISIHHRSFFVALHLSVWFRQTICQEYSNFGVLLEEVNEPLVYPWTKDWAGSQLL